MKMHSRYGTVAAALVACLMLAPAAYGQQDRAKSEAKKSGTAAKKPAKPATTAKPLAAGGTAQTSSAPRTTERPIPREQLTPLGRLTVPGGSLGYESRTSINAYDLSDGRRVPGYDNIQRNDSSYFGLSIRMPTSGLRSHGVD